MMKTSTKNPGEPRPDRRIKHRPLRPLTNAERELVRAHIGIAHHVANRVAGLVVSIKKIPKRYRAHRNDFFNELVGEAYMSLCLAAQRFDDTRGCKFSSYAFQAVWRRLQRAIRTHCMILASAKTSGRMTWIGLFTDHQVASTRGEYLSTDIEILDRDEPEDPCRELNPELSHLLHKTINGKRDEKFLRLRVLEDRKLQSIAEEFNLSKERVRQILLRGLRKIKNNQELIDALFAQAARKRHQIRINQPGISRLFA